MIEGLLLDKNAVRVVELEIKVVGSTLTRMHDAVIWQILGIQSDHIALAIINTRWIYIHGDGERRQSKATGNSDVVDHADKWIRKLRGRSSPYTSIPSMIVKYHFDSIRTKDISRRTELHFEFTNITHSCSLVRDPRVIYFELVHRSVVVNWVTTVEKRVYLVDY